LSPAHRDDLDSGCLVPSLAVDVGRAGAPARRRFERRLSAMFTAVAERAGAKTKAERERVVAGLALAVGGVVLARAVPSRALSDEILAACQKSAERLLDLEASGVRTKATA
jgi:TetR/AcrR family transcriptional repressor of nem operon